MSFGRLAKSIYFWVGIFTFLMVLASVETIKDVRSPETGLIILLKEWGGAVGTFGSVLAVQLIASRIQSGLYTRLWLSGGSLARVGSSVLLHALVFMLVFTLGFMFIEFSIITPITTSIPIDAWANIFVFSALFRSVAFSTFHIWMATSVINIVPSRFAVAFYILIALSHLVLEKIVFLIYGAEKGQKIAYYLPSAVASRLLDSLTDRIEWIPLGVYVALFIALTYSTSRFTIRLTSN